ncbi:unnamed protein product [marine sediment metagenome]|uniref:GIY-YIG domain-containing protein n=1 Tax=marine sediment metagenome TaxID=412755 RepID=X1EPB0_9ZZZZ
MIVYLIRNKINGKCYVGLDRNNNKRWPGHLRRSKLPKPKQLIDRKIKQYGTSNFEYQTLKECNSIEDLKQWEVEYIKQFNSYVGNEAGYNLTLGGDGCFGFKMTQRQIEKNKGVNHYMHGKKQSLESNIKRSLSLKGKNAGDKNVFKRPEVRKKVSEFAKTRIGILNPNYRHGQRCKVSQCR